MKRAAIVAASFVAGAALCFAAVIAAGAGHGTYVPLALIASPTILLQRWPSAGEATFWIALCLAPCYWALITWVATGTSAHRRAWLSALLTAQYAGAVLFYVFSAEPPARIGFMLRAAPGLVGLCLILYVAAQVAWWRSLRRTTRIRV